jgi:hypothetical protein
VDLGMSVVVIPNPLRPGERSVFKIAHAQYARDVVPPGTVNAKVVINGQDGTLDSIIWPRDIVVIVVLPAAPVAAAVASWWAAASISTILVSAVVNLAIGAVLGAIFKPKKPASASFFDGGGNHSPSYSIGAANNQARLGAAVPVVYGTVPRFVPDYAAQPYVEFHSDRQYIFLLFCLGVGDVKVNNVYIGNTLLTTDHDYFLRVYPASQAKQFGTITADWNGGAPPVANLLWDGPAFIENAWSSDDFSDSILAAPNQPLPSGAVGAHYRIIGPYIIGKSNYQMSMRQVFVDVSLPRGLYEQNKTTGEFLSHSVTIRFEWELIDDNNQIVTKGNTDTVLSSSHDRPRHSSIVINPPFTGWASFNCSRIRMRAYRVSLSLLDRYHQDEVVWTGMRVQYNATGADAAQAYQGVTIAAMRVKASEMFSSGASQQVSMDVTRLKTGTTNELANPAEVYEDILSNPLLIASPVPALNLDIPAINAAKAKWEGVSRFNGVLDSQSTAWEAAQVALQVAAAAPMRVGQQMTIVHDCVKDKRIALFGRGNIVAASLRITYVFAQTDDPDGVKVEYRDPQNFDPRYVVVDLAGAESPLLTNTDNVTLFGCTDRDVAKRHAILRAKRRTVSRKMVQFETELDGLTVLHGDRIAVSHDMPSWGQSGYFVDFDAATKTAIVEAPLDWAGSGHMIVVRDIFGDVHTTTVTKGADDSTMILGASYQLAGLGGDVDPTPFSFGTSTTAVTDWIVSSMTPQGTTVLIEAVAYDPSVYNGALPWQAYDTAPDGPPPVYVPPAVLPDIPAMEAPPAPPSTRRAGGIALGIFQRVPKTGEVFVEGQFMWLEHGGSIYVYFGNAQQNLGPVGPTTVTAPDGTIYHKGAESPVGGRFAIWAEWKSTSGAIPPLPGEPGYIPPDVGYA